MNLLHVLAVGLAALASGVEADQPDYSGECCCAAMCDNYASICNRSTLFTCHFTGPNAKYIMYSQNTYTGNGGTSYCTGTAAANSGTSSNKNFCQDYYQMAWNETACMAQVGQIGVNGLPFTNCTFTPGIRTTSTTTTTTTITTTTTTTSFVRSNDGTSFSDFAILGTNTETSYSCGGGCPETCIKSGYNVEYNADEALLTLSPGDGGVVTPCLKYCNNTCPSAVAYVSGSTAKGTFAGFGYDGVTFTLEPASYNNFLNQYVLLSIDGSGSTSVGVAKGVVCGVGVLAAPYVIGVLVGVVVLVIIIVPTVVCTLRKKRAQKAEGTGTSYKAMSEQEEQQ